MVVVHVVEALGGGVYTYFKNLTCFFGEIAEKEAIETIVIYSSKRKEVIPENVKKELSSKVRLIEIDMVKEISLVKDFKSVLQLKKLFKQLNPDIIHLHSSKAGVIGRVANSLLLGKRKKIFYTPHGYSFLRLDVPTSKRIFYKFVEKYFQKFFGGTTVACGDTEYEIAKTFGKSVLVRNGINLEKIGKFYREHKNERLVIGTIGRIMAQKNPKLFNDIALCFPKYDFIWIGDGEDRASLTAPNIRITGWFTDNIAVFPYLNQLDIYLQTSLWEGLPIAVLEAMALKKPIIATNIIGNKDIIVQGETGFLFDKIEELDTVFPLLEKDTFRIQMGEKTYQRCLKYFNTSINFSELIKIYNS